MKNLKKQRVTRTGVTATLFICITITFMISCGNAFGKTVHNPLEIMKYENGKLDANLHAEPLKYVMDEFSRVTSVHIRWINNEDYGPVSMRFSGRSLDDAVKHILSGKSHMLYYRSTDDGDKLSEVWIMPGTEDNGEMLRRPAHQPMQPYGMVHNNAEQQRAEQVARQWEDKMTNKIHTVEQHLNSGNTAMAEIEIIEMLNAGSEPMERMIAIDMLRSMDLFPTDELISIALSDPEPVLREQAAEYLSMHAENDPRINDVLIQVAERGNELW